MKVLISFLLVVSAAFLCGCSSHSYDPISVPENDQDLPSIQSEINHQIILSGEMIFDPDSNLMKVELSRESGMHYNVTGLIPRPEINIISYDISTYILDVDVTLSNSSSVTGRDVRLIIFTDLYGHTLVNSDGFTSLYDIPGGSIINPFKAYAKTQINRKFAAYSEYTEKLQIYMPSGNFNVKFAIDASFPTNCVEPYEISGFTQGNIYNFAGSSTEISVSIFDWQSDVKNVFLYCPEITGNTLDTLDQKSSETWGMTLVNNTGTDAAYYNGYIIANSYNSPDLYLYKNVSLRILSAKPEFDWVGTWGSTNNDLATRMAIENDEFIYIGGGFNGTVDLDPGPGVDEHESEGDQDAYISKFDMMGNYLWGVSWGSVDQMIIDTLRLDSMGNIYVAGCFDGTADFDPGEWPGILELTSVGYNDAYLSKFDSDGNFQWARSWGGNENEEVRQIAFDASDNPYTYGEYESTNIDFDPSPAQDIRKSHGPRALFLSKFNTDGIYQWAKTFGSDGTDYCGDLMITESEQILTSGRFEQSIDFDDQVHPPAYQSNGGYDAFLAEYIIDGNFSGALTWGGTDYDSAKNINLDSGENLIVVGYFSGTIDFDPGPGITEKTSSATGRDIYVSTFDPDQNLIDVNTWSGTNGFSFNTVIGKNDEYYFYGMYGGTIDFDPGPEVMELTANGNYDMVICRISQDFQYDWVSGFSGPLNQQFGALVLDEMQNLYSCGSFFSTIDFDPGTGLEQRTSMGQYDAFFLKLTQNN